MAMTQDTILMAASILSLSMLRVQVRACLSPKLLKILEQSKVIKMEMEARQAGILTRGVSMDDTVIEDKKKATKFVAFFD